MIKENEGLLKAWIEGLIDNSFLESLVTTNRLSEDDRQEIVNTPQEKNENNKVK